MRRYIIASHHLLAHGLKDTLNFLTSMDGIIDISAYMDNTDLPTQIKELFDSFDPEDEVVMMTDMLGGSVNQQFCPYVNDHRHLICGINLPCALSLVLQPQDMPLTAETIRTIVEESRSHLIYVNEYNDGANEDERRDIHETKNRPANVQFAACYDTFKSVRRNAGCLFLFFT